MEGKGMLKLNFFVDLNLDEYNSEDDSNFFSSEEDEEEISKYYTVSITPTRMTTRARTPKDD